MAIKQYLWISVLCLLANTFAFGMDRDVCCGKSVKQASCSISSISREEIATVPLRRMLACEKLSTEVYLQRLQQAANLLYLQTRWHDLLARFYFSLQQSRVLEPANGPLNFVLFVEREGHNCELSAEERTGLKSAFVVGSCEGKAVAFQLMPLVTKKKEHSLQDIVYINSLLTHTNDEVRDLAHAIKHKLYFYERIELLLKICKQFDCLLGKDNWPKLLGTHNITNYILDICFADVQNFSYPVSFLSSITNLFDDIAYYFYVQRSSDCFYEFNMSQEYELEQKIKNFLDGFTYYRTAYEQLYARIYAEIDSLIASKRTVSWYRAKKCFLLLPDLDEKLPSSVRFVEPHGDEQYFAAEGNCSGIAASEAGESGECKKKCASDDDWLKDALPKSIGSGKQKASQQQPKRRQRSRGNRASSKHDEIVAMHVAHQKELQRLSEEASRVALLEREQLHQQLSAVSAREAAWSTMIHNAKVRSGKTFYDERIAQWTDDEFIREHSPSSVFYHSFSSYTDPFILAWGIATPWQNRTRPEQTDTNYSLPGEIIWPTGKRTYAVFSLCKDPRGCCYHRGYTKKSADIIQEYGENLSWKIDTAGLESALLDNGTYRISTMHEPPESRILEQNDLYVRIWDARNNVTIILYKLIFA